MSDDDVPSPIDFRDPAQAKAWEATTMARRPYRTQFFAGFVAAICDQFSQSVSLLELGSGPGHLTVVSFLILARDAATPQERERFFELAEMYKRLAREEATNPGAAPSRRAA